MGKIGTKLPSFCLNRIRPHVRVRSPPIQAKPNVRVRSPPIQAKPNVNSNKKVQKSTENIGSGGEESKSSDDKGAKPVGRKIMIVVDSSVEAKGALQWALSHTVQSQDLIVLLHITKPSKQVVSATSDKPSKEIRAPRAYELVNSLKNMCQLKRPEIQIEIAVVEGKEKGPVIVEEAKKQEVALLVLGQKKRSTTWRLIMMWARSHRSVPGGGSGNGNGVVEYCIQNADCMAIAVRRKSKRHGGYLITTKRHKDFWLLA